MRKFPVNRRTAAQTAIEYLILLGVVTAIAIAGFRTFIPRTRGYTNEYFDKAMNEIWGEPPNADPAFTAYP